MTDVPAQYQSLVSWAAEQIGIPEAVVAAQINEESGFNPNVTSDTGAMGMFQFEPGTYATYGSGNAYDPNDEVKAYVAYMKVLLQQFDGDMYKALEAYNAGPGNLGAGAGYASTIMSNAGQGVNSVTDTYNANSSSSTLSPYNPTTNVTPTLSPQELAQQYGFAYSMLQSIPELNTLFQQAVAGQWDATRFQAALMATQWYQQHSSAQRAWIAEGYADPSTQTSQLNAQMASVQAAANSLGAIINPDIAKSLATEYLMNGWNSNQLQQALAQYINFDSGGALGGTAGQEEMTLRGLASNNGITLAPGWYEYTARHIAQDTTTLEDAEGFIRQQAEKLFPQYSKMIASGHNMTDLAAPYIQDYQRILEVGPGQTTMFDPTLVKALQYKDPEGKNNTMPLWQFDQSLRNDPRWLKTQNAQDTTMGVAHGILQDFGFSI